jgi:hypothetical protein
MLEFPPCNSSTGTAKVVCYSKFIALEGDIPPFRIILDPGTFK